MTAVNAFTVRAPRTVIQSNGKPRRFVFHSRPIFARVRTQLQQLTALRLMPFAQLWIRSLMRAKKAQHSPADDFLAIGPRLLFGPKKSPAVRTHVPGSSTSQGNYERTFYCRQVIDHEQLGDF